MAPGMENSSYYEGFGSPNIRCSDSDLIHHQHSKPSLIHQINHTRQAQNPHFHLKQQHSTITNPLIIKDTRSSVAYESKKLSAN